MNIKSLACCLSFSIVFTACGGGEPPAGRVETTAPPVEPAAAATETGAAASAPATSSSTTASATSGMPTGGATITGVIKFEGTAPQMPAIQMSADPICASKHTTPVKSEGLVLGAGNTMGNVFVSVKEGLPAKTWPVPSEPAVIDQRGCQYHPHILAMMVGQTLKILNSDGTLHNVHAMPKVNAEFNMAMPKTRLDATKILDKPEAMFPVKCDVHPWMGGWMTVMTHPFFSITSTDGKFKITGLPAGTYTIEAWQEKLGTKTASVTVVANGSATQDFTFARP